METLPWAYAGRNRALLLGVALVGLLAFFAPWVHESAPELRDLSGFGLAHLSGLFWAPAVAWFVVFPLVLTRRSIYKMRGARVAVAFLAATALITVGLLLGRPPVSSAHRPVHLEYAWGLYTSGLVAVVGVLAALGFGGKLDDIPTQQPRHGGEILH